jgi:hypothetical protein
MAGIGEYGVSKSQKIRTTLGVSAESSKRVEIDSTSI